MGTADKHEAGELRSSALTGDAGVWRRFLAKFLDELKKIKPVINRKPVFWSAYLACSSLFRLLTLGSVLPDQ
jgi:hypothetical protein